MKRDKIISTNFSDPKLQSKLKNYDALIHLIGIGRQTSKSTFEEISKSQQIRLIDVFFIAPFLFYIAYKSTGITEVEKLLIYIIAIATLYYNGKNYLQNKVNRHIGYIR